MSEKKEKKEIDFKLSEVKEKPTRAYAKGSKYDKMLDAFNTAKSPMAKISVDKDITANYLRTQLHKRITSRKLKMTVSVVNNEVYLEKELTVQIK